MQRSNFFGLRLMQGYIILVLLGSISISYCQTKETPKTDEASKKDPILSVIEGSLEQYKERDGVSAGGSSNAVKPEPPSIMGMMFQLIIALGITLVLIYLTVALLKRFFLQGTKKQVSSYKDSFKIFSVSQNCNLSGCRAGEGIGYR